MRKLSGKCLSDYTKTIIHLDFSQIRSYDITIYSTYNVCFYIETTYTTS